MSIYAVEIHGKFTKYIGITEHKSEAAAAVRVAAEVFECHEEMGHDVSLGSIRKYDAMKQAKRYCKRKFPDHAPADPDY